MPGCDGSKKTQWICMTWETSLHSSCVDHTNTLQIIVEANKFQTPVYQYDFEQGFQSLNWDLETAIGIIIRDVRAF